MIKKFQQERHFAVVLVLILALIGLWPLIDGANVKMTWLIMAGILLLVAWLIPRSLSPVVRVWIKVGHVLGVINSHIILALAFYLVITPVGLFFKIIGRDALALRWRNKMKSYWHRHDKTWPPESFKNQF